MIIGAHTLWYSHNADADRTFLRDVIGLNAIDIGHGWMIFKMPSSEAAVHPAEAGADSTMLGAHVYFMCDDLERTMAEFGKKGVTFSPPSNQRWGIVTTMKLPSGGEIGLYQPLHQTVI